MAFSILKFGDHVKKFGSNFNQGFGFLSKSNLKLMFICVWHNVVTVFLKLMRVLLNLGHKDFTIILLLLSGMRFSNKN